MARRFLVLSMVALAGSSGLVAQTRTTHIDPVSEATPIDKTTQTEDVRFRTEVNERMTVPVRIAGTGPYQFLVDTGADRTAISRQLAGRLKFAASDSASLHSVAGVSTVSTATVPTLQLTRNVVRNINAPLLDGAHMGADGILGVDSLRSQRIMFDFEAQTMSVVPSAVPDFRAEPGTIVVQGKRRNGRLIVTEAQANEKPVTVVIDTGSQISIGNEALRRELLGANLLEGGTQQVELQSVTGEKITGDYMIVRQIKIGDIGLKNLAVVFTDAHTFRQLKLDKRPALLLGMNAMRAFKKVSIDFASRKLRVVIPEQSALELRLAAVQRDAL